MIKCFIYENFKSFEKAELNLEEITSLIGLNSSGKSNAIEGIQILAELATGLDLSVVLDGTRSNDSHVRGGSKGCCRFNTSSFQLGCLVDLDEEHDLLYYIRITTDKRVWVEEEGLYKVENGKTNIAEGEKIFQTKPVEKGSGDIKTEYADKKTGRNPDISCMRVSSVLSQMKSKLPQNTKRDKECLRYIDLVLEQLKHIFVLNPIPSAMRDYVRMTDNELKSNCENISPVLHHLCENHEQKKELLRVICNLPENEVLGMEFIKTSLDDVMFALKEKYVECAEVVDAKRLSDGTLRCIAVVAAMLSIPENSALVIEEIDNGIHPGRVQALIDSLDELGRKRKIDLILTTHNPVLLNHYNKKKLLGVSVVYRDKKDGSSKFVPLVDIRHFQEIFAEGGLGDALIDDSLIRLIKEPKGQEDYSWLGV